MAHTFGPGADPFNLAGQAGKLEKFHVIDVLESDSQEGNVGKTGLGEYIPATDKRFGEKTEITAIYEANDVGAVGGGTIAAGAAAALNITRVEVKQESTKQARVTVVGHKHGASNHDLNARNIVLPDFNGFGCNNFFGASLEGVVDAEIQSAGWAIELGHVDKPGNLGAFLCGRTQGAKVTASIEATADTKPTLDEDTWKYDTKDIHKVGEDYWSVNCSGSQFLPAPA
jgi:hypothetical protein